MTNPFLDLQNGFYNAFSQGLGYPLDRRFQMVQPSAPLVPGANQDKNLWNYFNNIPPFSQTHNYILSGGNQFTSNYTGLLSALVGAPNDFVKDVGPQCNAKWLAYANTLPSNIRLAQYPAFFRKWATLNDYINVAAIGASDLSQLVTDPIFNAQRAIMAYKMAGGANAPTWGSGYKDLTAQLARATAKIFKFDSSSMNTSVSNSWAQGLDDGVFGLWGGSSFTSTQSAAFATSSCKVVASFKKVLQFLAVPGDWYSSSAMGLAYANQSGAPWDATKPINWQNTFGANGNMQRFAGSMVVVSGMNVQVTSRATFSSSDQTTIQNNSAAGMWPFYIANSSGGANTSVIFNEAGNMTVSMTSQPGVPIVVGVIVEPVGQFLGHR